MLPSGVERSNQPYNKWNYHNAQDWNLDELMQWYRRGRKKMRQQTRLLQMEKDKELSLSKINESRSGLSGGHIALSNNLYQEGMEEEYIQRGS